MTQELVTVEEGLVRMRRRLQQLEGFILACSDRAARRRFEKSREAFLEAERHMVRCLDASIDDAERERLVALIDEADKRGNEHMAAGGRRLPRA